MENIDWNEIVSGNIEKNIKGLIAEYFESKIVNKDTLNVIMNSYYQEWNKEYHAFMEEDNLESSAAAKESYDFYENLFEIIVRLYEEGHSDSFIRTTICESEYDVRSFYLDDVYNRMSEEDKKADVKKILETNQFNEIGKAFIVEETEGIFGGYYEIENIFENAHKYEQVYAEAVETYKSQELAKFYTDYYIRIYKDQYAPEKYCAKLIEYYIWAKNCKDIQNEKEFEIFMDIIDDNQMDLFPWASEGLVFEYLTDSLTNYDVKTNLEYIIEVIKVLREQGYPVRWKNKDTFWKIDIEAQKNMKH